MEIRYKKLTEKELDTFIQMRINQLREEGASVKNRKLDILKQSRGRKPMPRPAVFRNRKKYDRNIWKDSSRKAQDTE